MTKDGQEQDLRDLMEFDVEGEWPEGLTPPAEGGEGNGGDGDDNLSDDDKSKGVNKAFAHQRRLLSTSQEVIREQQKMIEDLKGKSPGTSASGVPDTDRSAVQAAAYEQDLLRRAMTNLGATNPDLPIVHREAQRLYEEDVATVRKAQESEGQAPAVQDQVFESFGQLTDDDKKVVRERLGELPVIQQADESVIRSEIHRYIGENLNRFSGNGGNGSSEPEGENHAAATSTARTRGSGVAPGQQGGTDGKSVKPASEAEISDMNKLGLDSRDLNQVALYRRSSKKRANYAGIR